MISKIEFPRSSKGEKKIEFSTVSCGIKFINEFICADTQMIMVQIINHLKNPNKPPRIWLIQPSKIIFASFVKIFPAHITRIIIAMNVNINDTIFKYFQLKNISIRSVASGEK